MSSSSSNPIFNRKILKNAVEGLDPSTIPDIEQKRQILAKWGQSIEFGKLKGAGEVALHGAFIGDLFASVLGYARMTDHPTEWNLVQEQKTAFDATKADAALGFFTQDVADIRAVIELKSAKADLNAKQHRKNDKHSAVEQAFSYAPKSGKHCDWLIVSNYSEWMEHFEQQTAKVLVIQQQIDQTDREIDRMVYELYGLSEDEIRIGEPRNSGKEAPVAATELQCVS